jgi:hypothetical protein
VVAQRVDERFGLRFAGKRLEHRGSQVIRVGGVGARCRIDIQAEPRPELVGVHPIPEIEREVRADPRLLDDQRGCPGATAVDATRHGHRPLPGYTGVFHEIRP